MTSKHWIVVVIVWKIFEDNNGEYIGSNNFSYIWTREHAWTCAAENIIFIAITSRSKLTTINLFIINARSAAPLLCDTVRRIIKFLLIYLNIISICRVLLNCYQNYNATFIVFAIRKMIEIQKIIKYE